MLAHTEFASPVGTLQMFASATGLVAILWERDDPERVSLGDSRNEASHPVLIETKRQLDDYFARKRSLFTLPLEPRGTAFQLQVWQALQAIPFGETRSYGELARQLGKPLASRAVGAANGRNPLSIVVPCHRVVGASGKLTGFAGGLDAKEFLLHHEQNRLF